MYNGKTVLGIIPARGKSKGVPRKNMKSLGGKPLIAWTIEESKKSRYLDRFILSSEDEEIMLFARYLGCDVPFVRPVELAQDDTPGIEPVLHALETLPERYDYVVLLQPTSPLRTKEDIDRCIELCVKQNASSCVSVTESDKSPYWMYVLNEIGKITPLLETEKRYNRRQDLPKVYTVNGAVYIAEVRWLLSNRSFMSNETHGYIMPRKRSVDIDTELDFKFAQFLLQNT